MPWSPIDSNLGLFEVVFVPKDVAGYGGIFAVAPAFCMDGLFAEAIADCSY
jgi:putative oxidoreductase